MDIEEARATQAAYDALVRFAWERIAERAKFVDRNPPYPDDDDSLKVSIGDDCVDVSYFERGHYDSGDFYNSSRYPAWLIFQDGDELAASLRAYTEERDREAAAKRAHYEAERRASERATYEALKRKFEG